MSFDAYLVRHAQSAGNAGLATYHPISIPLTEEGLRQAEELAASFPVQPSIVAISPFLRAQQTARPLLNRFLGVKTCTLRIHEFTYLNPEQWSGTTTQDRLAAVTAFWQRADAHYCDGGEAESFADFMKRADDVLDWLHVRSQERAVLVCHEYFIRAVLWRCFCPSLEIAISTMPAFRAWQLSAKIPNASVTRVSMSSDCAVSVTLPFELQFGTNSEKDARSGQRQAGR